MLTDEEGMQWALEEAELALASGEVPVGCVFVHPELGSLSRGSNRTNMDRNATRHAELVAIDAILKHHPPSIFQECVLYVTVEPCVMCAAALMELRLKRVVFGCWNERFGGMGGVLSLHCHLEVPSVGSVLPGIQVEGGCRREEAILLLRRFYLRENEHAPVPKKKTNRQLKLVEKEEESKA